MMGLFDAGLKEGNRFFTMTLAQAKLAADAVRVLEATLPSANGDGLAKLRGLAVASAEQRRVLIDELHKTFITPLDREDLFNLSHCYDDMVKYSLATLEEMQMLAVAADEPIRRMVALVREEAEQLELAVQRLPGNPRVAGDHANAVHEREAQVEHVYRAAIRDVLAGARDVQALPGIFYRREVYRHISNMSDRADAAANVFGMVVMKLA